MASNTLQLSGLVSGFDWKTFVDQTMEYERVPINRIQREQAKNDATITSLSSLQDRITTLKTAVTALQDSTNITARTSTLTTGASGWSTSASAGTAVGTYEIDVTQLATQSQLTPSASFRSGAKISTGPSVVGVTLSTMKTNPAVTAGTFTVNGQQVTIALSDSLQDVFDKIAVATSSAVTASYDFVTDTMSLSGSSTLFTGAATDTSNFLTAMKLYNNGSSSITSANNLGSAIPSATLANTNLATTPAASGTFTINGVSISYTSATDTLATLLARITNSTAGVSASYDPGTDQVRLLNKATGNTAISVADTSGNLLEALGLTSATSPVLNLGDDAEFTINGGSTYYSKSNTLTSATHGIDGLSVVVASASSDTVTVASDTAGIKTKINTFLTSYNDVQTYIRDQTAITTKNGKVTTNQLTSNAEVQSFARTLRSNAFASVSGLSGTINRLESLGIDFIDGESTLEIADTGKLDAALADNPDVVSAFFTTSSTGFAPRLLSFLDTFISTTSSPKGYLITQQESLSNANDDLDDQIAAIERRLEARRSQLEASFIAMEAAQQKIKNSQSQLVNAFPSNNSSK